MTEILAGIAVYANVFLRVYQQKLVGDGRLLPIFVNSWLIEITTVATIVAMVQSGWGILPYTGMGAALGSVSAVLFHGKIKNDKRKK